MIFEAAPDQTDIVGQQGRGQRIALESGKALAIEAELERLGAIDLTAGCQAAHFAPRFTLAARRVEANSCVPMFRSATIQDRHPIS